MFAYLTAVGLHILVPERALVELTPATVGTQPLMVLVDGPGVLLCCCGIGDACVEDPSQNPVQFPMPCNDPVGCCWCDPYSYIAKWLIEGAGELFTIDVRQVDVHLMDAGSDRWPFLGTYHRVYYVGGPCDINLDGDNGTDDDIIEFFRAVSGLGEFTGSADFDDDGDAGTDADIALFFTRLGGG